MLDEVGFDPMAVLSDCGRSGAAENHPKEIVERSLEQRLGEADAIRARGMALRLD